ncbi:MAG: hypothetical protein RR139_09810 [Lachnospiraceae bacterium]
MLKRINPVLSELVLELIVYGVILQFIGVWFVTDKISYSVGLWIGVVLAIGMAINMAVVIYDAVDLAAQKRATMRTAAFAALRYIVVILVFVVVGYLKIGNPITMFIGVMGLKVAAYLQPFTHKIILNITKKGDNTSSDEVR